MKTIAKNRLERIKAAGGKRLERYREMRRRQDEKRNIKKSLLKIGIYKERVTDSDIVNVKLYRLFLTLKRIKEREDVVSRVRKREQQRKQMKASELQRCYKCKETKPYNDFYLFRIQRKRVPQICKECERKISRNKKKCMSTTYIKYLIIGQRREGLSYDDIPDELVKVKRLHLNIKRALKAKVL